MTTVYLKEKLLRLWEKRTVTLLCLWHLTQWDRTISMEGQVISDAQQSISGYRGASPAGIVRWRLPGVIPGP